MKIQCIRDYDSKFYSKSSLLICSFIHSNDNTRFKPLDYKKDNLSRNKLTRVNSSILQIKYNIFDILRLVPHDYSGTDAYASVGLATLKIYFIVIICVSALFISYILICWYQIGQFTI